MTAVPHRKVSPEEYLELERQCEYKSEYIDGQIVMMAGSSRSHSRLSTRALSLLDRQLAGRPCEPFDSDVRVRIPRSRLYTYPDVTVACPPQEWEDDQLDTLLNPKVIIEVLSPSTEGYDRGQKWLRYQQIPSLTDYILLSQDAVRAEHWRRDATNQWIYRLLEGQEAALDISSIGCTLLLSELFERIEIPQT